MIIIYKDLAEYKVCITNKYTHRYVWWEKTAMFYWGTEIWFSKNVFVFLNCEISSNIQTTAKCEQKWLSNPTPRYTDSFDGIPKKNCVYWPLLVAIGNTGNEQQWRQCAILLSKIDTKIGLKWWQWAAVMESAILLSESSCVAHRQEQLYIDDITMFNKTHFDDN